MKQTVNSFGAARRRKGACNPGLQRKLL